MSISQKLTNVPCVGAYYSLNHGTHSRHISELKYAPTHGTFPSFLEIDKTVGAYSLQIYDYLRQITRIKRKTKAFRLIVRHNTERPLISDWQWRHRTLFLFVGSQNRVNLVIFFKPWLGVRKLPSIKSKTQYSLINTEHHSVNKKNQIFG